MTFTSYRLTQLAMLVTLMGAARMVQASDPPPPPEPREHRTETAGFVDPNHPILPRRPELSAADPESGLTNPIDRLLRPYFQQHGLTFGQPVEDRVYARRVFLDLTGLSPTPKELDAFLADERPDKRALLVRKLLDDRRAYAEHWLSFWNDALRNAYRGTGFIDGGRKQITGWLYQSLYENKPYDQFLRELISPVPGSEGFTKGIIWRGVVNASQQQELQAAQNMAQVFLGINLKCASCHDSFISEWTLSDAYALANVFAQEPLEMHRCDKPIGEFAETRFLYPQLGTIDADAPRDVRMRQLAEIITGPRNGRMPRTIVNRLWARLFGRGLIEPVDVMSNSPWNADLLDWLASDLADHDFNLKHTLELICTSRAYQLPAMGVPSPEETEFVFRGPYVKRMTAEQFVDAISTLTGNWQEPTPQMLKQDGRGQGGQLAAIQNIVGEDSVSKAPVRAALAMADPLMQALGRPNREQVVTRREPWATTLQALELTNGDTLDRLLKQGAKNWWERDIADADTLIDQIYQTALGRRATKDERASARELVGTPVSQTGIQDFLWVVVMLPEFQLIH